MTISSECKEFAADSQSATSAAWPAVIATIFRGVGTTGVHTHFQQFGRYLEQSGSEVTLVTPFSWNRLLAGLVFSPRLVLRYCSPTAGVVWYRHWHEAFLYKGLRRKLANVGECVIYAQGPLEARSALRARRGPHQRVVMAVHFRSSQADEHAEPGREIKAGGATYRAIRRLERETILQLQGIVYVSRWARDSLLAWLPEAAAIPSAVISNAVSVPTATQNRGETLADIVTVGRLDAAKNHRFLLEVLAEAKRGGRVLTLDIYGDGPLRSELARQVTALGLEGQVRLKGFRCDVRDFLPCYRAYVHASYLETSSLAIIEAMAAGLPVVAGKIGGIPEIVEDDIEGRFWPLDDPVSAAAMLVEFLDSGPGLEKAATAALDRFHREFDISWLGPKARSFLFGGLPDEFPRGLSPARGTRDHG